MIYENIKEVAKEKGKSINKIETDLNLGKATISKWNRHRPSIDKVAYVASYLGVNIERLIDGDMQVKDDG